MNGRLILELIGLRYKLIWAKTRSRNGRIALFLSGYLLLLLVLMVLGFGGLGAGIAAVRSGKALVVAEAVLGSLFLQAIISTNILGFGMSNVFSETELRRYPLTASERRLTRHLTSLLDPFWFLFLALELGLALGLYGLGAAEFWPAVTATLLFFFCNYCFARLVGVFVDRLIKRKGGAAILLGLVMTMGFLPGPIAQFAKSKPELAGRLVDNLAFTPPFAAAAAMLLGGGKQVQGFALLVAWIAVAAALIIYMEKRPPQRQAAVTAHIAWNDMFDRVGAFYGSSLGPLVAHWLRFYARNPRTRTIAAISIPLMCFLTYQTGRSMGQDGRFVAALGTVAIVTFLGTSRFAVNQFGYSGGAFRRYFLLPTPPETTLQAASYAGITLGAAALPIALLLFAVFVPPFDTRKLIMLLSSGLTGMFLFHAAGLWVTLYNPRKGNYDANFGNDLSLGGNVVLIGGVIMAMLIPRALHHWYEFAVSPQAWVFFPPLPLLAAALYRFSLRLAGPAFRARKEKLLAVVEGRD